jgi:hypothetical protein
MPSRQHLFHDLGVFDSGEADVEAGMTRGQTLVSQRI